MTYRFDLVVIGTGAAAHTVAVKCRRAGWSVAVIDSRPFGGTCALRGCDPKKVLVGAAAVVDAVRRFRDRGVQDDRPLVWSDVMRFKSSIIADAPRRTEEAFRSAGIELFRGRARFAGRNVVDVERDRLEARRVVVATGAMPADLHIGGEGLLVTSDEFLELDRLPPRIAFLGGGFISFEFAHVAARAGASASVIHRGEHPLRGFDPDLVNLLVARSRALGIDVRLSAQVRNISRTDEGVVVHGEAGGLPFQVAADMVVHGAGRVPEIDDLNLTAGDIAWTRHGVTVDAHLRSVSNPDVYAGGDAAASGAPRLTPVAAHHGHIMAANLLDEANPRKPDHEVVPSVVFTLPPLASVGLRESVARERGLSFDVRYSETSSWFSSRRVGESHSGYKVLIDKSSERILGAHLLGPNADEVINVFAIAMRAGMTASSIKKTMFAYPTSGSDVVNML